MTCLGRQVMMALILCIASHVQEDLKQGDNVCQWVSIFLVLSVENGTDFCQQPSDMKMQKFNITTLHDEDATQMHACAHTRARKHNVIVYTYTYTLTHTYIHTHAYMQTHT